MHYALDKLEKKLAKYIPNLKIEIPPNEIKADLAIPCFKTNPRKLAKKITAIKLINIKKIEIAGHYINLTLDKKKLAKEVFREINGLKDKYGWHAKSSKKKILIEYSSPNIAKPLHIGHLRNTALGNSLAKIYQANGYSVITENWLGDWGKQYGLLLLAYQKWGANKKINIEQMSRLYTRAVKQAAKNQKIDDEAREIFRKIEQGDKKLLKLWKKFREISVKDFKKTYKLLDVKFNVWTGESFYVPMMPAVIREALEKKAAVKESDAVVVDLNKFQLESFLLAKSDGASLYSARDLAAAKYRLIKYKPEKIIYVVGHEQELYLKQIFKTLEIMGYPANKFLHISYGIVTQSGTKMSTRAGNIVKLEDVLNKAIKKTANKKVGVGAVLFSVLSQGNRRNIAFDFKQALNLKGGSAPYIQYGYVRAKKILDKSKFTKTNISLGVLNNLGLTETENNLILTLARFPKVTGEAQKLNEPHLIANYLNKLVQEFNRFYEENTVLKAEKSLKEFRLHLVISTAQVIKNGLWLLGIETPNKM